MKNEKYYCPCGDFDCPYFYNGVCELENPKEDCDDFAYYYGEDEEEE